MRILILSDLHSNHQALQAVLNRVRRKRIDRVVCLGDFVGYGAQPNQVLDKMRALRKPKLFVRGNHDRVAVGTDNGEGFNFAARSAALWTREHLSKPNRRFLETLPVGPLSLGDGVAVCHGSPFDEDEYLFSEYTAYRVFHHFTAKIVFFGHTHLPVVFGLESDFEISAQLARDSMTIQLDPSKRYLVNPGSVGQPRDRNPAASFVIFDTERLAIQYHRVEYDVERAGDAILRAGLPRILADRLVVGT